MIPVIYDLPAEDFLNPTLPFFNTFLPFIGLHGLEQNPHPSQDTEYLVPHQKLFA